jgi:transketolase
MTITREHLLELTRVQTGDAKHEPAATSTLDVIWTLYERVLSVSPDRLDDPDRDRFYVSKGHGPMAYFAVLAAFGYFDPVLLPTFRRFDSPLGLHPDRLRVPGVEISSGSLGHGLALGIGTALALRMQGRTARTIVLMGDHELQEGSNHEAIAVAGRFGLGRLSVVVIDNSNGSPWPGGPQARFAVEGWSTAVVDGRDREALATAFALPPDGRGADRPTVVVADVGAPA